MLIKLSSGYEINPERVDAIQEKEFLGMIEGQPLFGDGRVCIAGQWFAVNASELAKIRTYHTEMIVVPTPDGCGWETKSPDDVLQDLENMIDAIGKKPEYSTGKQILENSGIKMPTSSNPTKPFTVQDLPKIEPSPEQKRIEELSNKLLSRIHYNCRVCTNFGTEECNECLKFEGATAKLTKYQPKQQPDCSGSQHDPKPKTKSKRSCSTCKHVNSDLRVGPCAICLDLCNEDHPAWEPKA